MRHLALDEIIADALARILWQRAEALQQTIGRSVGRIYQQQLIVALRRERQLMLDALAQLVDDVAAFDNAQRQASNERAARLTELRKRLGVTCDIGVAA